MIADNRIAELSEADNDSLKSLLTDDVFADYDKELTGFDSNVLSAMLGMGDKELEAPNDFDEFNEDLDTKHTCPKCGYEWS